MTTPGISDLEVALPSVVKQAALDFAAALASSSLFKRFETASAHLRDDQAAQKAMRAYQEKQQSLQAMLLLNAGSEAERAELERLRQAFLGQPAVADYLGAEAELRQLCQRTAGLLSRMIDLDFATACGTGCC